MKRAKGLLAAVLVIGGGWSSSVAHAGDFDLDMCLKRAAGGLSNELTVVCAGVRPAIVEWACIVRAYTWYNVEVASCIAMDANADQRLRKPLL
jgi:hypothetical protein